MSDFDLTVRRGDLFAILGHAIGVVERSPIPVLKCVLLDASDSTLTGFATDLVVGMKQAVDANVRAPGRIAVNASLFMAVAKELPEGDVSLKLVGEAHLEVRAGRSRLKVPVVPAEDFPVLPTGDSAKVHATIASRDLLKALGQGAYAAGERVDMPQLGGVSLEFSSVEGAHSEVLVVSTDGNRLAVSSISADCSPGKILLPPKGLAELRRLADANKDGAIELRCDGVRAYLLSERVVVSVKMFDLAYPAWRKLLPPPAPHRVEVSREELLGAVRRVAVVSEAMDGGAITVSFSEGSVRVTGSSADNGEGEEHLNCTSTGAEPTLILSPRLLAAALGAMTDDDVRLELSGSDGALLLSGVVTVGCRAVLMPRRSSPSA